MCPKHVVFNPDLTIIVEEEYSLALHEARKSDYAQRQADKIRYHNLLTPILSSEHRKKIIACLNTYYLTKGETSLHV
jgi:hypothetical protein